MSTSLPSQSDLELEIQLAKIFYNGSYEKIRINKIRAWTFQVTAYVFIAMYLAFATYFIDVVQTYFPSVTSRQLMDYVIYAIIVSFAFSVLLSIIVVRDKPWDYIFLHYNQAAVEAAEQAGAPLVPPSPTPEERERSQQAAIADQARIGSFSASDYVLFGATALIVCGIAFKQDITTLLGTVLILSAKFRLMFYGMARFGSWQGGLMYLGATILILAVFACGDGGFWEWLKLSL